MFKRLIILILIIPLLLTWFLIEVFVFITYPAIFVIKGWDMDGYRNKFMDKYIEIIDKLNEW